MEDEFELTSEEAIEISQIVIDFYNKYPEKHNPMISFKLGCWLSTLHTKEAERKKNEE